MDRKEVFEINNSRLKVTGNIEVIIDNKLERVLVNFGGETVYRRVSNNLIGEYMKICELICNKKYNLDITIYSDGIIDYRFELSK
ncbi:hypothetical protein CMI39_00690 [Candidatus Pacearchaeota archaeon]|jgi:hypothetical protein|nr:hypothetical protein [Candidatus Pacearchaeota archaeon]|tara:strand:- start:668 stop:922 length:255 start_codon:yes stop_codon:yes gene_type:complete